MIYRLNLVEKVGSGINRMKRFCSAYNIPIDFEISKDWFRVVFHRRLDAEGLNGQLSGQLKEVLNSILNNPGIKVTEIAVNLNKPYRTIIKQVNKLIKNGLIERKGSKKTGGYWVKK